MGTQGWSPSHILDSGYGHREQLCLTVILDLTDFYHVYMVKIIYLF